MTPTEKKYSHINLMPNQWQPFNGDHYLNAKFLELRDKHNIKHCIELGTCLGSSTLWLSDNFHEVSTCEINREFMTIAQERMAEHGCRNVNAYFGSSVDVLPLLLDNEPSLIFIDSHWGANNPLLQELEIIKGFASNKVIVIHDFKVPGKDFQYDTYPGITYEWEYIKESIHAIYPEPKISYNERAAGAKVGVIIIEP